MAGYLQDPVGGMMSKYVVKSDRAQTVPGLGVFQKDEEREFTEQDAEGFKIISGLELHKDNTPEGITVTKSSSRTTDENKTQNVKAKGGENG